MAIIVNQFEVTAGLRAGGFPEVDMLPGPEVVSPTAPAGPPADPLAVLRRLRERAARLSAD